MQIVSTSDDNVLVKEGGEANLSCRTNLEWFFCLWRHPSGVKECIVQENGTFRDACARTDHLEIFARDKLCSLKVDNVDLKDHGSYMCLFNQADVFHTDQIYVSLEVASPAQVTLRRKDLEENVILELVDEEMVELECEGGRGYPSPAIEWIIPGKERVRATNVILLN